MNKRVFNTVVIVGALMLRGGVCAAGFEGHTLSLTVDTPKIGNTIGGPAEAVVGNGIEFGPSGSGDGYYVVSVDIDVAGDTLLFDYSSSGSGYFASGTFNGYVFTDVNDSIPDILGVSIDSATNMNLTEDRVFFNQNQIFVNVASLSYNSDSRILLHVYFAPEGGACSGNVSSNLDFCAPSLNYQSADGLQKIWADFSFYGQGPNGELLWKLKDFGVKQ